jgi:small multidrug resistance pump
MDQGIETERWMSVVLWLAAVYNVAYGCFAVAFPLAPFQWAGMEPPNYPTLFQCIGMIVGVYGVGYAVAARNPLRHWPIVLVGLLGKVFGPIGFLHAAIRGELPWVAGWMNATNDLIWWVPFTLILHRAYRANHR